MKNKMVLFFTLFAIALLGFIFLMGCNTTPFKPTIIKGQPDKCNDMYTLMDFTTKLQGIFSKGNSAATTALTLMTLSYGECSKERDKIKADQKEKARQKRFDDCRTMIYGAELLPKEENYKRYSEFLECIEK